MNSWLALLLPDESDEGPGEAFSTSVKLMRLTKTWPIPSGKIPAQCLHIQKSKKENDLVVFLARRITRMTFQIVTFNSHVDFFKKSYSILIIIWHVISVQPTISILLLHPFEKYLFNWNVNDYNLLVFWKEWEVRVLEGTWKDTAETRWLRNQIQGFHPVLWPQAITANSQTPWNLLLQ